MPSPFGSLTNTIKAFAGKQGTRASKLSQRRRGAPTRKTDENVGPAPRVQSKDVASPSSVDPMDTLCKAAHASRSRRGTRVTALPRVPVIIIDGLGLVDTPHPFRDEHCNVAHLAPIPPLAPAHTLFPITLDEKPRSGMSSRDAAIEEGREYLKKIFGEKAFMKPAPAPKKTFSVLVAEGKEETLAYLREQFPNASCI